jgi:hypothetical protein
MKQVENRKFTQEPENQASAKSDKEQDDMKSMKSKAGKGSSKKKDKEMAKSSKHEEGHDHPALDYETYKRNCEG